MWGNCKIFAATDRLLRRTVCMHFLPAPVPVSIGQVRSKTCVWAQIDAGLDTYLAACCAPRFRRIVLEEAPRALGWSRWRELEMRYFGAIVRTSIERLAAAGEIVTPSTELTAQVFLGATSEAALAVAASEGRAEDRSQAKELLLRLLGGLRPAV